jgi:glyoxylase-like metal-dependent hydrolase (beta-lactamase superfamily II)
LGDALGDLKSEFKIPLLLHPIDAGHRQALNSGLSFENPIGRQAIAEFGFEALLFPGQTDGSIMLYSSSKGGGVLLTGDSASGTSADQAKAGVERLIRPPIDTSIDDAELRRQWLAFDRPVATVLPFHGTGYVGRSAEELASIMKPLVHSEPKYWNDLQV